MERFQGRRHQWLGLLRSPLSTFDPAASVESANQRPALRVTSMPTAAGVRPGPHRPGDRSPAAPPADARPPGTLQGTANRATRGS